MEKRLKRYIEKIGQVDIANLDVDQKQLLLNDLLIQIGFFQHERLIHLIVTLSFSVLTILSVGILIISISIPTVLLSLLLAIMLIAYIKHYYVLENGVQKLYKLYDALIK